MSIAFLNKRKALIIIIERHLLDEFIRWMQQQYGKKMLIYRHIREVFFLCSYVSRVVKQNENKCLYKSFGQLLYLSLIDRISKKCNHQHDDLLLINAPDLSKVNRAQ